MQDASVVSKLSTRLVRGRDFKMRRGRVPLEFCESTSDTTAHLIITEGGQARGIVRTVFLQLKCVHVLLAPHPSCGFRLQA